MKVLVIGGTLFIGRSLVGELVKAGHEVTVLHRRRTHDLGKKVANIQCDRNDPDATQRALRNTRFEIVLDNVYDWERGTTASQVEATVRACGDHIERYIFMSSVAAYGDGLNHHEGDALAPDNHPNAYARNKATSERSAIAAVKLRFKPTRSATQPITGLKSCSTIKLRENKKPVWVRLKPMRR